jgi:hypothetical protein
MPSELKKMTKNTEMLAMKLNCGNAMPTKPTEKNLLKSKPPTT